MFVLIRGDAEELISERANCRTECVQFSEVKDGHVSSAGTCLAWVRNKLSAVGLWGELEVRAVILYCLIFYFNFFNFKSLLFNVFKMNTHSSPTY